MARTKTADRDMTQGGIFRALLLFSLPLLAGNFFQQCYNTVDSIVLGLSLIHISEPTRP